MPAPSTSAPPALSPSSQSKAGAVADASNQRRIASRPSSRVDEKPAVGSSAAASGAFGPPSRAPLPTKQPKANTSAKTTGGGPAPLPRLPAPLVDKMAMAAVISPSPTAEAPKISMTSKEWVIPPRPKPGRKPATDTPPTKRKAQNRAAQRAFRERRAARVGELEVQLDEQKDAHQQEEAKLKEKIRNLELDVQSFRSRCVLLENMLDRERHERIRAETQAETLKRRHGDDFFPSQGISRARHSPSQSHRFVHQIRHSLSGGRNEHLSPGRNFAISNIITPPESLDISSNNPEADAAITCGNCSPQGRCACAEEVLASASAGCGKCGFGTACQCLDEVTSIADAGQDMKRPASPSAGSSDSKRQRPAADAHALTETDFTAMFSRKPAADNTTAQSPYDQPPSAIQMTLEESMPFKESCGFCKDGTYCVCAEDAAGMATPAMTPTESTQSVSHQTQTPPPSEPDIIQPPLAMEMTADGAVKLPRRIQGKKPVHKASPSSRGGCGANGPGTCAQCQADPKSGLFCRLMNAKYSREQGSDGGGCCGGKGAGGGGCCRSKTQQAPEKITLPSLPSLGLSCAEAYQTLSSHRNFSKAADDISSWLPKLKTTPQGGRIAAGRQAIEVEAASIMSVLKEFDVRFGREC
ncbi:bZIP transcription factor HapX [Metarhizium album ARSEF 1941]|uniref:BZIP transcription factor HapX n=1 Tax=Metarhizium album (strain ARSEF 1941) TaxID=1081103 RepID=A0A0B2WQ68_METAS|nr:bZIP transcription factor HapX [Metarhizium album ARSEF 1941]KHN95642.1 bZIP transcription factor HapX [Metarhizium album ARSEF 1941]